jgi:lipid-binding SYLF domain-containing protein
VLIVACCFLCLWPSLSRAIDLAELEEVVDESRLTFARFTGHPSMSWFRDHARNARAVFIAPRVTTAGYFFGGTWGTGLLLVRNPSTGQWSEPAFYRLVGASFGLQIGGVTSEIVALATSDLAAGEMVDGAFTLGVRGLIGFGRMGGGITGSLDTTSGTGFISVATATGVYGGVALGGTLVLARHGANELYYGRPVELADFKKGLVRQWYSERLIRAVAEATTEVPESQP